MGRGQILHDGFINKQTGIIHRENSYWPDEDLLGMSHGVHFSVVETWQG
jgi:hypothetical protein